MRIKKYVADTMPEALKLVKADLGPRAVILNTRTVKKSSALGMLGKGQVEVTAAVDEGTQPARAAPPEKEGKPRPQPAPVAREEKSRIRVAGKVSLPPRTAAPRKPAAEPPAADARWADRISRQIEELQAALRSAARSGSQSGSLVLPGALEPLSRQLEETGLARRLAEDLLKTILLEPGEAGLKELKPLQERAACLLATRFRPPQPTRLARGVRAVVALVGPAGSGKTTAAARIASHFSAGQNARVAFVAADTDRVGGLEQLRAYAGILNMPLDMVYTPEDMGEVIRARREVDLVLIDTAGASPVVPAQVESLGGLLREAAPSEIHLVLGAPTGLAQMVEAAEAFAAVGVDRLLLTKLDETGRLGAACTLAAEAGLPLSYFTDGRSVPGNLHPASPEALARLLLKGRSNGAAG